MLDDAYDRAVGLLYEAALEPARWDEALAAVATVGGAENAGLSDFSYSRRIIWRMIVHNIDDALNREYLEKYAAIDVRIPLMLSHDVERLWSDHRDLDLETRSSHPVYKEYLNREGPCEYLFAPVARENDRVGSLMLRRVGKETACDDTHKVLMALSRHMDRAIRISRRFAQLADGVHVGEAALDALGDPVALLRQDGSIYRANEAFERLLAKCDTLGIETGLRTRLVCRQAADQRKLMGALADVHAIALRELNTGARHPLTFSIGAAGPRPLKATVAPMPPSFNLRGVKTVTALLQLVDPAAPPNEAVLMQGLKLTPAEARLACDLTLGGSLKEVARRLGISVNTVKTQLSAVYGKTSTSSRADLVKLLADLPR